MEEAILFTIKLIGLGNYNSLNHTEKAIYILTSINISVGLLYLLIFVVRKCNEQKRNSREEGTL